MPWVRPDEYEFASVDFTPNYLCHHGALKNIYFTAKEASTNKDALYQFDTTSMQLAGTQRNKFNPPLATGANAGTILNPH